jgi:sigma-B regulation protein RsbU (phosphoserine phosphatase)
MSAMAMFRQLSLPARCQASILQWGKDLTEMHLDKVTRGDIRRFFQQQQILVFAAVAVFALLSVLKIPSHLWTCLVFALCIGNLMFPIMIRLDRYYSRLTFPLNWLVRLLILAVVSFGTVIVATGVIYALLMEPGERTRASVIADIRLGTVAAFIVGIVSQLYGGMKTRLESQNVVLREAVQTRTFQLEEQERELETAREIQGRLIPARIPQLLNLEIVGSYQPARVVGGDYFDVIKFSDTRVAVCIADVVGKGIAAALLMANVQAAVKAFAVENAAPSEICAQLNRVLCSNLALGKFVTFFYCVIDTTARTLAYSNAGHCFPLLHRSRGNAELLGEGGIVLGIFPESKYWDVTVQFDPGNKVLLFTDGITEATNTRDEEYGEARLRQRLDIDTSSETEAMHRKLMQEVSDFCLGNFADDATLVLISFL